MKKANILIASIAIFFGFFVFTTSLIMASQDDMSKSEKISKKTLYIGRPLPDHVLYPVLMVFDRSLLTLSAGESKVEMRIKLGQDRMISAQMLLQKGNENMALSTMTKSQKYLILAAHTFLELESHSPELKEELISALETNTANLKDCKTKFVSVDTAPIGDLITESDALIGIVKSHPQT